ncbi:MAG TPA: sialidase family protein [Candidatus Thermoplasmatota archaeon]|jgi:hypothetical protein|nr:sialidase family protein [Candidatus Thermoplasmatota archaeon]
MKAAAGTSLAVIAIALAGCVSAPAPGPAPLASEGLPPLLPTAGVVHGVDGLAPAQALTALLAGTVGELRYTGADHDEPTIGVDSQGNVYVSGFVEAPPPFGSSPTVMRSQDQGATWENVGPRLPTGHQDPPTTLDPYIYVDPTTDRVFDLDLYAACAYLSWSDDQGASWSTNPLACGTPVVPNDHQSMVAAKPVQVSTRGYENVLYYCVNRVADTACARSLDGGTTFEPLTTAYLGVQPEALDPTSLLGSEPRGICGGLSGHIKAGPEGTLYLPRDYCGVPSVAISQDDGATWRVVAISSEQGSQEHEVAIAVDDAGNVYAFWGNATGLPLLAVSRDQGQTWSAPRMVGPPGLTAMGWPAIAAGAEGRVAFAYIGSTMEGGYEGKQTETCSDLLGLQCQPTGDYDNATWNAYIGVVTDALSDAPTVVTATANDPSDPVARGVCGRTRCHGIYDFIDIVIDPAGRPWAAFDDACTDRCATDPAGATGPNQGFVGTLAAGPALRGALAALPPLPAVAPPT